MVSVRDEDIISLCAVFFLVIVVDLSILIGQISFEYVSEIVNGVATVIGVLTGLLGVMFTYIHSTIHGAKTKKWMRKRIDMYLAITFLTFTLMLCAYFSLLGGNYRLALLSIFTGLIIVLILFWNTGMTGNRLLVLEEP